MGDGVLVRKPEQPFEQQEAQAPDRNQAGRSSESRSGRSGRPATWLGAVDVLRS